MSGDGGYAPARHRCTCWAGVAKFCSGAEPSNGGRRRPRVAVYENAEARLAVEYVSEGNINMVLRYVGSSCEYRGLVLRFRKGEGRSAGLVEDSRFQRTVITPLLGEHVTDSTVVEVDSASVKQLNDDSMVQLRRPSFRRMTSGGHLDTKTPGESNGHNFVLALMQRDLSFCPGGISFEIKLKCGVQELSEDGVSRFTLQQLSDYGRKRDTISTYDPVELFRGVLGARLERVREQLSRLHDVSHDATQNNLGVLGEMHVGRVTGAQLDNLAKVLVAQPGVLRRLRALDLLAAGQCEIALRAWEAIGAPNAIPVEDCERTQIEVLQSGGLIERLEATEDDRKAIGIVRDEYARLLNAGKHRFIVALFLLGRTLMDCSVIANVCTSSPTYDETELTTLGYVEADRASRLWGRLRVIDTDIKPAKKIKFYGQQLVELQDHPHSNFFLEFIRAGGSILSGLRAVERRFARDARQTQE
mmetsp:Transcript_31459/g.86524  ORF Transcript_31459/g.86524 Transcript_31459/m.86524 type:complete len:473 (+) Transcript_31459:83-1501(+)